MTEIKASNQIDLSSIEMNTIYLMMFLALLSANWDYEAAFTCRIYHWGCLCLPESHILAETGLALNFRSGISREQTPSLLFGKGKSSSDGRRFTDSHKILYRMTG